MVDTTSYVKRRGEDFMEDGGTNGVLLYSIGDPSYLEVALLAEDNGPPDTCHLYVWIDPGLKYVINLNTGEKKKPEIGDFGLLEINRGSSIGNRDGVAYQLPNQMIFRFHDLYLDWTEEGCFGAVTVERDDNRKMFAK